MRKQIAPSMVRTAPGWLAQPERTFVSLEQTPQSGGLVDGQSFAALLRGVESPALEERPLFFGSGSVEGVRLGKWKYLTSADPTWKREFKEQPMHFDLKKDPSENTKLVDERRDVAARLRGLIDAFQEEVDYDYLSRH